jgi:hypothetical protein
MNTREFKCVKILTDLIENEGLIGIKTSFEDEGALFNETVRLKEVCNQAKTKITLKIGGPEAIRDLKDSSIIGVKGLVAPMVESEFGLKKFIQATRTYIPDLKKFLEFSTKENLKGIYNFVQEGTGSDLYFFSSVLKVDKFSHLDPHDNTPEQVLTFEKDQSLDCCDVNCSKLLQIYPHMIDLKAAVLICWENIKDKLTKDH